MFLEFYCIAFSIDINSLFFCELNCFHSACPKVDRDDERNATRGKLLDGFFVKSISFAISMWDIDLKILISDFFEKIRKKCCARNPFAIEIGVHGDAFIRVTVHPETFALDNILAGPYTYKSDAEAQAYREEFWDQFDEATGAVSFKCGLLPDADKLMQRWLAIAQADLHWAGQQAYGAHLRARERGFRCDHRGCAGG